MYMYVFPILIYVSVHHICPDMWNCAGAYVCNVECMYTSAFGHTTGGNDFILGIYTDTFVSRMYMK